MKASDLNRANIIATRLSAITKLLETRVEEVIIRRPGLQDHYIRSTRSCELFARTANQLLEDEAAELKREAAQIGLTL